MDNLSKKIKGIDVSRWQGAIDFRQVAASGYRFVIMRATVGDYYTDPKFGVYWRDAADAGLLLSAYHVVIPGIDPAKQLAHFDEAVAGLLPDLPFVLDVEVDRDKPRTVITETCLGVADAFLARYEHRPIIYTRANWWNKFIERNPIWSKHPLHVAHYTNAEQPAIPLDWKDVGWTLWQYSSTGSLPYVQSKNTDLNVFAGGEAEFQNFLLPYVPPKDPLVLDSRQIRLLRNVLEYTAGDPAGLPGHQLMMIIAELARTHPEVPALLNG